MKKVSKLLFVLIASVLCISTMCSMAVFAEDAATVAVSIKADKETRMGIIADIKQELRKAYALKISYAATQRTNY